MNIGMLWFDNTKTDLFTKIERAAGYYQNKYGRRPNLCFVHPSTLKQSQPAGIEGIGEQVIPIQRIGDVEIRANRSVVRNHLWIGIDTGKAQITASAK
jgi:hypothetical protein